MCYISVDSFIMLAINSYRITSLTTQYARSEGNIRNGRPIKDQTPTIQDVLRCEFDYSSFFAHWSFRLRVDFSSPLGLRTCISMAVILYVRAGFFEGGGIAKKYFLVCTLSKKLCSKGSSIFNDHNRMMIGVRHNVAECPRARPSYCIHLNYNSSKLLLSVLK